MIVAMKKVTLVCLAEGKGATLDKLRDHGILHLTPVRQPEGDDLDRARAELHAAEWVAAALRPYAAGDADSAHPPLFSPQTVNAAHELLALRNEIEERIEDLEVEKEDIEPLGHFDPRDIRRLREKGLFVRIYRRSVKEETELPEGVVEIPIDYDGGHALCLAGLGDFEYGGEELPLPDRPLAEVERDLDGAREQMALTEKKLKEISPSLPAIRGHARALGERMAYLEAEAGMGGRGRLAYLQGFCPADRTEKLRQTAREAGWGLLLTDPAADEAVPTLIRHPRWVRMIKPMFHFLGIVPGYRESDISSPFLVFLSIFFAMIVGDVGYGLLLLMLTPYMRRKKFSKAPPETFRLLMLFSVCTIAWGVLTANYFGIDYEFLPGFLQSLRIDWLISQNNSMTLSLALGAVHLSIAHAWRAVRYGLDVRASIQVGWIALVWTVFFVARVLLVNAPFPSWMPPVSVAGLITIVAGLIWTRQWMNMGFLLLDLVSCFGDLMSYLRLFALGIASVKVAEAFNGMAGDLGAAIVGAVSGSGPQLWAAAAVAALAMGFVLIVGHGLNIILCAMSVLVHGVRLNALEFSLHVGQEWSGFNYKPFGVSGAAETA